MLDNVPLAAHTRCVRCELLAGPAHPGLPSLERGLCPPRARDDRRAAVLRDPADRLLTPAEAAEVLGVTAATVRQWVRTGALRAYQLPGARARKPRGVRWRIRALDVRRFLAKSASA